MAPTRHGSWEAYCSAEFGISRAQAYRLLDVARALGTIQTAVTAADPSRMRDTDPAAAAALDYGLSQRALIAVSSRTGEVAELISDRLLLAVVGQRSAAGWWWRSAVVLLLVVVGVGSWCSAVFARPRRPGQ